MYGFVFSAISGFCCEYIIASSVTVCVMNVGLGTTGLTLPAHLSIYAASHSDTRGDLQNKKNIVSDNIAGSLLPRRLKAEHFQMFESLAPSFQCYLEEGGENLKGRSF